MAYVSSDCLVYINFYLMFQTWTSHLFNVMCCMLFMLLWLKHAATLKLSSRNKMRSVAAFFVEIQVFEVLYALNFVCDTTGGEKSFMQT